MNQDYKTISNFTVLIASCLLLFSLPFLPKANALLAHSHGSNSPAGRQAVPCSTFPQLLKPTLLSQLLHPALLADLRFLSVVTISSGCPGLKPFIALGPLLPIPSSLVRTLSSGLSAQDRKGRRLLGACPQQRAWLPAVQGPQLPDARMEAI